MKKLNRQKLVTLGLLVLAVVATVEFQKFMRRRAPACEDGVCRVPSEVVAADVSGPGSVPFMPPVQTDAKRPLPTLIDFGSGECATCKIMNVVLDELAQEVSGKLKIQFVDAREQTGLAEKHSIRMIPTQIFFDADGNELFRHEGFISKEDILKKWAELGIKLSVSNE